MNEKKNMTLAEALSERKNLQREMANMRSRLRNSSMAPEGTKVMEQPEKLLATMDEQCERMEWLTHHINLTNLNTQVDGESLTALTARREALRKRVAIMQNVLREAEEKDFRNTRRELKTVVTLDTKATRKEADAISQALRKLDLKIQATNFGTQLM